MRNTSSTTLQGPSARPFAPATALPLVWALAMVLHLLGPAAWGQQTLPATPAEAPKNYEEMDLQELFEAAGESMEAANWEEALKPLEILIKEYGEDALEDYGPMFGVMYFRKGFCLKNLKRFEEALAAYEISYSKFTNSPQTPAAQKNPVWELTRLEMGIIKQAMGKFEEAVADYEAFAANPAPAGNYDDTAFRIQAAAAYTKAGKAERGRQLIEQLFQLTGPRAPRPDALMRAMLTLLDDYVNNGSAEATTEAHRFLDQYATRFSVPAFDMQRFEFNNRLIALARKAADNQHTSLSIRLISFIASSSAVLEDLKSRAQRMLPAVSEALQKEIEKTQAQLSDPNALDWVVLLSLAGAYERSGNPAGAFAIYQRCIQQLPASPHRELMLFGAMRSAMNLRQMEFAQTLGTDFRKEFPESKFASVVSTIMLESLFFSRQYTEALRLAKSIRDSLEEKSEGRDLADFVIGASLYNLDQPLEAKPELDNHSKNYPESRFREHVRFFAASTYQKLRDWKASGERYDAFFKDFPNSEYTGYAMMERGTCHFQLGEFDKCLEVLGELQKRLPNFPNLDSAIAMRGDAHLMLENTEQAEASYLKARELAIAGGANHKIGLSRILVQLVRVAKALEKSPDVVAYYDEYMKEHKGGFYDGQIIVSAIPALKEINRGEEALNELQNVIIRLGSAEGSVGIEEAIGSYTELAVEVSGPEALLEKLLAFVPRGTEVNNTLRAWLIMARIDLLQNDQYKDQFPKRAAQIQVAFEELRGFDKAELATYILVQVGRNLANQDQPATNALAVEWFDAVLSKGDSDHYPLALMGKARILASSGEGSAFSDAIDAFDKVVRDLKDKPEYVEEAMLGKARLYFDKKLWKEASQVLFDIQSTPKFTRFRPEVFAKLGRSYEELGKLKEALEAYTPFVAPPLENYVEFSAEARVRAAEIVMKQGDKTKAFRLIKDTVSRMHKLSNHPVAGPFVVRAKELYKTLKTETNAESHPDEGIWGVR